MTTKQPEKPVTRRKLDQIRVSDYEGLDRRKTLTDKDREEIRNYWLETPVEERKSMREIGAKYGVHRTTISAVLSPEARKKREEKHKARCKEGRYYNRERHVKNVNSYIAYKRALVEAGDIQISQA